MLSSSRLYRIACVVMAGCFLFASAAQVNDPDAFLWGAFYLAAAVVSLLAFRRTVPPWMSASLGLIAALWAALLAPAAFNTSFRSLFQSWRMMSADMEVGREFLGLLIVIAWMSVVYRHARRGSPRVADEALARASQQGK